MLKLWYREKYVLTTEQVAEILGTDPARITWNFKHNAKRYIEGKHYFRLKGEELKQFKQLTNKSLGGSDQLHVNFTVSSMKLVEAPDSAELTIPKPTVGKRSASMILWTRLGLLHHVKSVNTDAAWAFYERMEEVYFNVLEREEAVGQPAEQLTLNGKKVWTLKQASAMFKRSIKQIQKVLYGRRFTRGTDFFVTDQRQLEQLSAENGQWFAKKLTLIVESGLTKLSMMYVEKIKAPAEETFKELREKVNAVMKAALDVNVFLSERSLVEA